METVKKSQSENRTVIRADLRQSIERAVAILKEAGADKVYLFGSVATGKSSANSDVDLAVTGLPPSKFFQTMGQVLTAIPYSLDLVDLDEDTPFTRYLKQKGKLRRVA